MATALTTGEAGRLFGVSAFTVAKWVDEGRLGFKLPSGVRRIEPGEAEAFRAGMRRERIIPSEVSDDDHAA